MNSAELTAIFGLAGVKILSFKQIDNQYFPNHPNYAEARQENPWFEVQTEEGILTLGPRKRVYELDWSQTKRRGIVTSDDVTKEDYMVHAWDKGALVTYLRKLRTLPLVVSIDPGEKVFMARTKKEAEELIDFLSRHEHFLTEAQKTILQINLKSIEEGDEVRVRYRRHGEGEGKCATLQMRTKNMFIDIKPH